MKEIKLTQGFVALVDDKDYDFLMQWKWHAQKTPHTFYACTNLPRIDDTPKRKHIKMHRFIMQVSDPTIEIDHKDGNGLNNSRDNLRTCTSGENCCNCKKRKNSRLSKYIGVTFDKKTQKWRAQIQKDKKKYSIGYFNTEEEAMQAYKLKAKELHGEFAATTLLEYD